MIKRDDLPEPNYLVNSSPGKWQVVWKVEGFQQEEAERLMRHLVRELGADPAATDSSRVLRLPGYTNHKYGKPFVVRAETRTSATYTPDQFPRSQTDSSGARSLAPAVSRDLPRTGQSQSERDWAYAKRALARGDSPQHVVNAISRFRRSEKSTLLITQNAPSAKQVSHLLLNRQIGPSSNCAVSSRLPLHSCNLP